MPDPDLICEVRCEGGIYRDWMNVSVSQDFSAGWLRQFSLITAEPSTVSNFRIKPGDRVDIALAGQVVIEEGYVKTRQSSYDGNRHAVRIDGYSKAGPITDASAVSSGTGQYRGYKIDAIARDILKPHGLSFRVEGGPPHWDLPFPQVMIRQGETAFALISRLCNQRGLWLQADAKGNLVAGAPDGGATVRFEEGKNILAANCRLDYLPVDGLVSRSQQPGSDSLFGRKAAEIGARADIPGSKGNAPRIILNEVPASQSELQIRTNMEAQRLAASTVSVTITYPGWLRPGVGGLWELLARDMVSVKSPMLIPTESGQLDFKLWGYVYSQDAQAGTQTSIELVNALAFGQRGKQIDALKDDGFFSQIPSQAQPEALT